MDIARYTFVSASVIWLVGCVVDAGAPGPSTKAQAAAECAPLELDVDTDIELVERSHGWVTSFGIRVDGARVGTIGEPYVARRWVAGSRVFELRSNDGKPAGTVSEPVVSARRQIRYVDCAGTTLQRAVERGPGRERYPCHGPIECLNPFEVLEGDGGAVVATLEVPADLATPFPLVTPDGVEVARFTRTGSSLRPHTRWRIEPGPAAGLVDARLLVGMATFLREHEAHRF